VVAVDRGRYTCITDEGDEVVAMRARELGRRAVVVGDNVALVGDTSGDPDALARIVRIQPRTSTLRRTPDDTDPIERVLVANADQLAVVTALADPAPSTRLIDRCLVAAFDTGIKPLLVLTKADLAPSHALVETYEPLGARPVVTRRDQPLDALADLLRGHVTAMVGHSGVGKSTLVNRLVPGADRATGGVNVVTGRGRHVSTSARALALPGGGWIIDTPGVRSFGLGHVEADRVLAAFPDLAPGAANCPRGCEHTADAPECALDARVQAGNADAARLESLRRLLESRPPRPGD
jgi:ribosome biogenesis GTPase